VAGRGGAYIFPRGIISFFCVTGSIFTTHKGVPTLNVPSRISTPMIIGSLFVNTAMIFSRQGQTACGAASFLFASVISALYTVKASNRWYMISA